MGSKEQRTKAIDKLENELNGATGIYLTDITKINVAKITRLRGEFRKQGIRYVVVKNSLARKALDRCGKSGINGYFKGQVGVAITKTESTVPARIIKDFHKENKELLGVKVAYVDGEIFSGEQVERLADIPSREVLLSMLLGVFQAPMANLAGALNGVLAKLTGTLEAVRQQKESGAAKPADEQTATNV